MFEREQVATIQYMCARDIVCVSVSVCTWRVSVCVSVHEQGELPERRLYAPAYAEGK